MKNILLPTDFSDTAHNAFEYALHLAEALHAQITLLHVYPRFPLEWNYPTPPVADVLDSDHVAGALERFGAYQREAQFRVGKQIEVQLLMEPGDPVDEIVRLSRHPDLDLLIMGTRGAASEREKVFGSVTAAVINRAQAPVLAIPDTAKYRSIDHIMYATTFREEDKGLMERLLELTSACNAHLSCVHVEESEKPWYQMEFKFVESMYHHRAHWHLLRFFNFNFPDIQAGVNQFIRETQVDVAAVFTHRHGIVDRVLGKSFSRDMLLHTEVPLLSYPSPV